MLSYNAWLLRDGNVGQYHQMLSVLEDLASKLADRYTINISEKTLQYNSFVNIPNIFRNKTSVGVHAKSKETILRDLLKGPEPDLIISNGRDSVTFALYLKDKCKNPPLIVQLHDPEVSFDYFDVLAVPLHQMSKSFNKKEGVIFTQGVPSILTPEKLKNAMEDNQFLKYPSPRIGVFLGGNLKGFDFTSEQYGKLAKDVLRVADNMSATVFFIATPRTKVEGMDEVKSVIAASGIGNRCFTFPWYGEDIRTYFRLIASSDFMIATVDSSSVISEACSVGKPLYLYDPTGDDINSSKLYEYYRYYIMSNTARMLTKDVKHLSSWRYKPVVNANKIGKVLVKIIEESRLARK